MELEQAIDKAVEAVGLQSLKPLERHVISSFVTRNDVFVTLPTGFGKSCGVYELFSQAGLLCKYRPSVRKAESLRVCAHAHWYYCA